MELSIETQLAEWGRDLEVNTQKLSIRSLDLQASSDKSEPLQPLAATSIPEFCADAERLAKSGRLVDAEIRFAQATAEERDLDAMVRYGRFLRNRGRFAQANGLFQRVLELAQLRSELYWQAVALDNLGKISRRRGELDQAERYHRDALGIFGQLGGDTAALGAASQSGHLGLIYRIRRQFDEALAEQQKALDAYRDLFDLSGQAMQCGSIGRTYQDSGEYSKAEEMLRRALSMEEQLQHPRHIGIVSGHLCRNYLLTGDLSKAKEMLQKSISNNEAAGDSWGLAVCDLYRGWIALDEGDYETARKILEHASESLRTIGVPQDVVQARSLLGCLPDAP